jgi:hypothetical protein
MRRVRPSQPDLFKTPPHQLPSPQRTTAVELLKVLLAEMVISVPQAKQVGNDAMDDRELGNEQDHR